MEQLWELRSLVRNCCPWSVKIPLQIQRRKNLKSDTTQSRTPPPRAKPLPDVSCSGVVTMGWDRPDSKMQSISQTTCHTARQVPNVALEIRSLVLRRNEYYKMQFK